MASLRVMLAVFMALFAVVHCVNLLQELEEELLLRELEHLVEERLAEKEQRAVDIMETLNVETRAEGTPTAAWRLAGVDGSGNTVDHSSNDVTRMGYQCYIKSKGVGVRGCKYYNGFFKWCYTTARGVKDFQSCCTDEQCSNWECEYQGGFKKQCRANY